MHITINDEVIASRTGREVLAVCDRRLTEFNAINVTTAIHRIAKRADASVVHDEPTLLPLLEAYLVPLRREHPAEPLSLAHTAWAFAKILFLDDPLRHAISAASIARLSQF